MSRIILLAIVGLIAFCVVAAWRISLVPAYPPHLHANFAIIEGSAALDFSSPRYMSISPCTDGHVHEYSKEEAVHLHDGIGNVVHVHADGITWDDLLAELRYDPNSRTNASLSAYYFLNGSPVGAGIRTQLIESHDRFLLIVATTSALPVDAWERVGTTAAQFDTATTESCSGNTPRSLWQRFQLSF